MKTNRTNFFKFKTWLMANTGMFALSLGFGGCLQSQKLPEPSAEQAPDSVVCVDNPIVTASFKTDTLSQSATALMYYMNNQIIRNYVEKDIRFRIQLPYIAHEYWHYHNRLSQYSSKYKFSPIQYANLCIHNEISANVAAILTADLEYLTSDNKDAVIKKYENTYMGFYFKALKDGKIKSGSSNKDDNDAKYRLLINGAIEMWQTKFLAHYAPSRKIMVLDYIHRVGLFQPFSKNYKKILSHMYTFGGIDFSEYLNEDVKCSNLLVQVMSDVAYCKALNGNKEQAFFIAEEINKNFDKLQTFNISGQRDALENFFIAAQLKYELSLLDVAHIQSHPEIVSAAYNKVMYTFSRDKTFSDFLNNCYHSIQKAWQHPPLLMKNYFPLIFKNNFNVNEEKTIHKFYTYQGHDLTKLISDFDLHRLPSDKLYLMSISDQYYKSPSLDLFDQQMMSLIDHAETIDNGAETLYPDKNSSKVKNPVKKRRLSDDQYVEIPDLEQPLFIEGSMSEEQWLMLKDMFRAFDDIDSVYKGCDADKLARHIAQHGRVDYFKKEDPFLRKSRHQFNKGGQKITLRDIKQRQKGPLH